MKKIDNYDIDNLMILVNETLNILYDNEYYLFENNSSERNIVFHFARYLIMNIHKQDLKHFNVDCEYNRNKCGEKEYKEVKYNYDNKKHRIYPDLIFHERGSNENNLAAIEFKKSNNYNKKSIDNDFFKLKSLTDKDGEFKYKLGLFICFAKTRELVKISQYINGDEYTKN